MNYFGCIYKIKNKVNNNIYIGQTRENNPFKRINRHFKKQSYIDLVYRSYLKDNNIDKFEITILCSCFDIDSLNFMEKYFINFYNSLAPNGYNLKAGGDQGGLASNVLKQKFSKMRKGVPTKGLAAKGMKKSKDHCLAMSLSRKGFTSENRKKSRSLAKYKVAKKIIAINIKTGLEICFKSIKDCSIQLNLINQNISETLINKNGRTQHKGWKFQFV